MSRIRDLPRRDWKVDAIEKAEELTALLRQPHGTWKLRPVQGAALWEAALLDGVFANIRVGGGKTLLSALIAAVVECDRPLLLTSSALVGKTKREIEALRLHWRIPKNLKVMGYRMLSGVDKIDLLEELRPDMLICDEAHWLKNYRRAACAKRVFRYLKAHPETKFSAMGATLMKDSFLDYGHLVAASLKDSAPVPLIADIREEWAAGLDANVIERPNYSIFRSDLGNVDDPKSARLAFQSRLTESPGVIITDEGFDDVGLEVNGVVLDIPEKLHDDLSALRTLWVMPDNWPLADARFQVWAAARQMSRGFFGKHVPHPPKAWWEARKEWCGFVRKTIERDIGYDTELAVREACEHGRLKSLGIFETWRDIGPTFEVNRETQWLSDYFVQECVAWGRQNNGLIVCESVEMGRAIAEAGGWDYYGQCGLTDDGQYIESEKARGRPAVASLLANLEGRNLQFNWHKMLLTEPPPNALQFEQILGRPHRDGQERPVEVTVFCTCLEDLDAMKKSVMMAETIFQQGGQSQKLLDWPVEIPQNPNTGPAWERTSKKEE